jgi:hypothetical protein
LIYDAHELMARSINDPKSTINNESPINNQ